MREVERRENTFCRMSLDFDLIELERIKALPIGRWDNEAKIMFDAVVLAYDRYPPLVAEFMDQVCKKAIVGYDSPWLRWERWEGSAERVERDPYLLFRRAYLEGPIDIETLVRLADGGHFPSLLAIVYTVIREGDGDWEEHEDKVERELQNSSSVPLPPPPLPMEQLTRYARTLEGMDRGEGLYAMSLHQWDDFDAEVGLLKRSSDLGFRRATRKLFSRYTQRKWTHSLTEQEEDERIIWYHRSRAGNSDDSTQSVGVRYHYLTHLEPDGHRRAVESLTKIPSLEAEIRRLRAENEALKVTGAKKLISLGPEFSIGTGPLHTPPDGS